MKLKYKLILILILVILAASLPLSLFILNQQEKERLDLIFTQGDANSRILAHTILNILMMNGGDVDSSKVDARETIAILDPLTRNGLVYADAILLSTRTKYNGIVLARYADPSYFQDINFTDRIPKTKLDTLLKQKSNKKMRFPGINGYCYSFITIADFEGTPLCAGRLVFSQAIILSPIKKLRSMIYWSILSAIIIVSFIGLFFSLMITRPIKRLISGVKKIESGDFSHRISVSSSDELGMLGKTFNHLAKALQLEINELHTTNIKLKKLTGAYSRFVPMDFLNLLNKESIIDVNLSDHIEKNLTIMFSDIRSFTELSESMTPIENFAFLNSYLKRMGPIIRDHGGFIDKYIGDGVMALFVKDVDVAITAGICILNMLHEYNFHRNKSGYKNIKIGIGLNTGLAMLGTIGDQNRMDGTVISDSVNIASRVERLTKLYGVPFIISEETYNKIKNPQSFSMRFIGNARVRGKKKLVNIYEVLNADTDESRKKKLKTVNIFNEGIILFKNKSFKESARTFSEVLKINPEDSVAVFYYDKLKQYFNNK